MERKMGVCEVAVVGGVCPYTCYRGLNGTLL